MNEGSPPLRGRGAARNPANRFVRIHYDSLPDEPGEEGVAPGTQFFRDASRTILTRNDSPDVGFTVSINPYRGCEHGCIYCYARPTHEYLGFSAGLDFETRILVKEDAPELLQRELSSRRWKPEPIALSGVTDPYQPVERRLCLTRRCLKVLAAFRNPTVVVTKNRLVTRDADLLGALARSEAALVFISVTTLDAALAAALEPRASRPAARLAAIRGLADAGVPVGVLVAPVIPGLNDHEIPGILTAAADAGARTAGYVLLRLPYGLGPLFEDWLMRHFPERAGKVLGRIRSLRDGRLNDPRFGSRMRGEGHLARVLNDLFQLSCLRAGLRSRPVHLSTAAFRVPGDAQPWLFD